MRFQAFFCCPKGDWRVIRGSKTITKVGNSISLRTINFSLSWEYSVHLLDGEDNKFRWFFLKLLQYEDFPAYVLMEA
jgi:hypothetical protein